MSVTVIGPRWSLGLHQDSCPRISDRGGGLTRREAFLSFLVAY